jgi:DMSO/TMAO reductase YedYZ heme-binding membrane subunit
VNDAALWAARLSGLSACGVLVAALSITPLSFVVPGWRGPGARAKAIRRRLGTSAAWLGLLHASVAFVGVLDAEPAALLSTSHLYAGLGALFVLSILLVTSYPRAVRALGLSTWKELHRLSYVAALLIVQHVALSPFADRRLVLALLGVLSVLFGARVAMLLRARRIASSSSSEGVHQE